MEVNFQKAILDKSDYNIIFINEGNIKIYLEKAILVNRAPFEKLELNFNENEIAVLSAVNGMGKTTILSHIVDAFYEMARTNFPDDFKGNDKNYYRISSMLHNIDIETPSFVYLRFKSDKINYDYIEIDECTQKEYDEAIILEDKIPFSMLEKNLKNTKHAKKISKNIDHDKVKKFFNNNILTYFPSYRYEQPGYLNDPYKINIDFKKKSDFYGHLDSPIEVIAGLPKIANWIMDIILDAHYPEGNASFIKEHLDLIITRTLVSKNYGDLSFDVGPRNSGSARIQIIKKNTSSTVYPTIFNLSSGEASMLCLFGELLRQADNKKSGIRLDEINGIVLVDEIDKHLHVKLQKEVLPKLLNLFPNVQFIVSSHSPFFSIGLAEELMERTKIVDLDNFGISKDPTTCEPYREVYNIMISENCRFKEMYQLLKQKIMQGTIPLIITEGKTDIQHIKKAKGELNVTDLEIDYFEYPENSWGSSELKNLLENFSKIHNTRKIIGIFDRDEKKIVNDMEKDGQNFKNYGNNVFAFCIPIPLERKNYENISIEFYYSDSELKKENNGKRLYFDNELNFDSKRRPISVILKPADNPQKKIYCENIGELNWIHSKTRFANLIETDEEYSKDIEFNKFNLIFDKIKEITKSVDV